MLTTLNNQLTQSKMNAESIATYISNLEKDNAALRKLLQQCEEEKAILEYESMLHYAQVSDDESVASDSEYETETESESESESESDESETPTVPLRDYPRSPYISLLTRSGDPPHRRIIQRNPNPPPRYVETERDTPLESPRTVISRSIASGTALSTASSLATVPKSGEEQELSRRSRKIKSRVFRPDKVLDKSKSKSIKEEKGKSKKLKSPPTLSKIINLLIPYIFVAFIIIYFIYFFKVREVKSKMRSLSTIYTTRF